MRKEMGNQNTSGILAEEKNTNAATETVKEISSLDHLKEENKILIQENETKDVQEKSEESDSQEEEADKSCPVEELTSHVQEVENGSVDEDYGTRTTSLDDVSSNQKQLNSEKGISEFDNGNEVHGQQCTINEEKQISESNFEAKSMSISSLPQEAVDIISIPEEDENMLVKENDEKLNKDLPQDEQNDSSDTHDYLHSTSLQDLSAAENEKQDEPSPFGEEKPMTNELVNEDYTISDPENIFLDDEAKKKDKIDQIFSSKFLESNPSEELKDTMDGLVKSAFMAQNQEEERPKIESSESETSMVEEMNESKENDSKEKLSVESNLSHEGHQVELKKSPSFNFSIPFDPKSQESDQTPLLYQDRPPMRSFSSCSGMRFQSRSVQTEYLGKSLHHETVEVEEKTITMERNHSESLRTVVTQKQDNLDEDCDIISPKGNEKRKPKSSLFTTCICCTQAIS